MLLKLHSCAFKAHCAQGNRLAFFRWQWSLWLKTLENGVSSPLCMWQKGSAGELVSLLELGGWRTQPLSLLGGITLRCTCHHKIHHFDILIILSWRPLRKIRLLSDLPCPSKSRTYIFSWEAFPPTPGRGEHSYQWRQEVDAKMNLCKQTYKMILISHQFPLYIS